MCRSKAAGGQRCASHNRAREASRARREARAAAARRDELIADEATELEIADARRDAARASAIAILSDPKLTDAEIAMVCSCADPQVEAESLSTAQAAVQAGRESARLSGLAATERLFERTDTAAEFEAAAADERSRMGRLVDSLLGNLHRAKWTLADRIADLEDTSDTDPQTAAQTDPTTVSKPADPEHGLLRSWLIDVLTEVDEAMTEMIVDSAAGLGITTPDPPAPTTTTSAAANTADTAPAAAADQPAADTTTTTAADSTENDHQDDDAEVGAQRDPHVPDQADDPEHQDDPAYQDDESDLDGGQTSHPQTTAPAATVGTPTAPTTTAASGPVPSVTSRDHTAETTARRGAAGSTAARRGSLADDRDGEHQDYDDHGHDEEEAMTFDPADLAQLSDAELLDLIAQLTHNSSAATTHGGEK